MTDEEPRWEGFGTDDDDHLRSRRRAVLDELLREIDNGHALNGRIVQVAAFFSASDDVIVQLDDGTFAHVHPTWTGQVERPGYPETTLLGQGSAVVDFMDRWQAGY